MKLFKRKNNVLNFFSTPKKRKKKKFNIFNSRSDELFNAIKNAPTDTQKKNLTNDYSSDENEYVSPSDDEYDNIPEKSSSPPIKYNNIKKPRLRKQGSFSSFSNSDDNYFSSFIKQVQSPKNEKKNSYENIYGKKRKKGIFSQFQSGMNDDYFTNFVKNVNAIERRANDDDDRKVDSFQMDKNKFVEEMVNLHSQPESDLVDSLSFVGKKRIFSRTSPKKKKNENEISIVAEKLNGEKKTLKAPSKSLGSGVENMRKNVPVAKFAFISGILQVGRKIIANVKYCGGKEGSSVIQWYEICCRTNTEKEMVEFKNKKGFKILPNLLNCKIKLKYTPVRDDGVMGKPVEVISTKVKKKNKKFSKFTKSKKSPNSPLAKLKKRFSGVFNSTESEGENSKKEKLSFLMKSDDEEKIKEENEIVKKNEVNDDDESDSDLEWGSDDDEESDSGEEDVKEVESNFEKLKKNVISNNNETKKSEWNNKFITNFERANQPTRFSLPKKTSPIRVNENSKSLGHEILQERITNNIENFENSPKWMKNLEKRRRFEDESKSLNSKMKRNIERKLNNYMKNDEINSEHEKIVKESDANESIIDENGREIEFKKEFILYRVKKDKISTKIKYSDCEMRVKEMESGKKKFEIVISSSFFDKKIQNLFEKKMKLRKKDSKEESKPKKNVKYTQLFQRKKKKVKKKVKKKKKKKVGKRKVVKKKKDSVVSKDGMGMKKRVSVDKKGDVGNVGGKKNVVVTCLVKRKKKRKKKKKIVTAKKKKKKKKNEQEIN